jgi:hypothetical protein
MFDKQNDKKKTKKVVEILSVWRSLGDTGENLKVHKIENFFGFDFEFCPISLLVMHK